MHAVVCLQKIHTTLKSGDILSKASFLVSMLDFGGALSTSMLLGYTLIGPGVTETLVTIVKKKESWRCQEFCGWEIWGQKDELLKFGWFIFCSVCSITLHSLKRTAQAPEKGWFEDYIVSFWEGLFFRCELLVSGYACCFYILCSYAGFQFLTLNSPILRIPRWLLVSWW